MSRLTGVQVDPVALAGPTNYVTLVCTLQPNGAILSLTAAN